MKYKLKDFFLKWFDHFVSDYLYFFTGQLHKILIIRTVFGSVRNIEENISTQNRIALQI